MLFVWRTPPKSDLLDAPERSRLIVVSLFPKACRNAKGNSAGSKTCTARAEIASSISTAFMLPLPQMYFYPVEPQVGPQEGVHSMEVEDSHRLTAKLAVWLNGWRI